MNLFFCKNLKHTSVFCFISFCLISRRLINQTNKMMSNKIIKPVNVPRNTRDPSVSISEYLLVKTFLNYLYYLDTLPHNLYFSYS